MNFVMMFESVDLPRIKPRPASFRVVILPLNKSYVHNYGRRLTPSSHMLRGIKNNGFLFGIVGIGIGILIFGAAPPYAEATAVLGSAFIIAGAVEIYMRLGHKDFTKIIPNNFSTSKHSLYNPRILCTNYTVVVNCQLVHQNTDQNK